MDVKALASNQPIKDSISDFCIVSSVERHLNRPFSKKRAKTSVFLCSVDSCQSGMGSLHNVGGPGVQNCVSEIQQENEHLAFVECFLPSSEFLFFPLWDF